MMKQCSMRASNPPSSGDRAGGAPGGGRLKAGLAALALSLCAAGAASAQYRPAYDDITETGHELANCAGAVAAREGLNPVTHAHGADLLGVILARLHVEPGLQGMTGRYAASAARAY